ncbi:MAG: hypothetical protein OXO50_11770 [Caldilineaceae bacterium]|nr:hypothetical protein [Caldilineaceae bacterium]
MTESREIELLTELSRIVAKYGPEQVTLLAELIRDPQRAEELATALEYAAVQSSSGKRPVTRSQKVERAGMQVMKELRLSDPEKHSVMAEIRRELISGTILRSMAELRSFAIMNDLSIGKASSRNSAISPLLRSLSNLSTTEIASIRDSLIEAGAGDRSLERWRDVIVRPRTSRKPGEKG